MTTEPQPTEPGTQRFPGVRASFKIAQGLLDRVLATGDAEPLDPELREEIRDFQAQFEEPSPE